MDNRAGGFSLSTPCGQPSDTLSTPAALPWGNLASDPPSTACQQGPSSGSPQALRRYPKRYRCIISLSPVSTAPTTTTNIFKKLLSRSFPEKRHALARSTAGPPPLPAFQVASVLAVESRERLPACPCAKHRSPVDAWLWAAEWHRRRGPKTASESAADPLLNTLRQFARPPKNGGWRRWRRPATGERQCTRW